MISPRPLNQRTLAHHAHRVGIPTYDRAALGHGVVHISVGAFHRSHQAVYFDALARRGLGAGWGLTGIALYEREMHDVLSAQDGLYTVVARGRDGDEASIVGSITRSLHAPERPGAVLGALARPDTRLVTLTITAGGYKTDPGTGQFAFEDPEVVADLADPAHPTSALGFLVEGLARRRRAGRPPFTILSCDNVPGNGPIARAAVLAFARARDHRLAQWIGDHVAFPSSMVDRITPQTTQDDRAYVAREFGVRDGWPVMTEPFSQWVVEDRFCHGRPPLEAVGVEFVGDVRPHSLLKTRLLNASHSALGYLGSLAGHKQTDAAMADEAFATYVERLMAEDIAPLLPPVPGVHLASYQATLCERIANPAIGDPLSRLCRHGSKKIPGHILSSIQEARVLGRPHALLTLAVAGWFRHLEGVDDHGAPLTLEDPLGPRLRDLARRGGTDPRPLLSESATFGSLGEDPGFAEAVERDLEDLAAHGARAVIAARVAHDERLATA